jgi:hypothetical protein
MSAGARPPADAGAAAGRPAPGRDPADGRGWCRSALVTPAGNPHTRNHQTGATWLRRGSQHCLVHAEVVTHLVNQVAKHIVANDDNYALAA